MLVIAHRGASAREPENSIAAFRAAIDLGADGVELDIHATADGGLIVHHDDTVAGTNIPQSSLDSVRRHRLANGEPVPMLGEVLDALGSDVTVFVEVKTLDSTQDDCLLQVLRDAPSPPRCHVHSFDHRIVHRLVARQEGLVGGVLSTSYPLNPLIQLEQSGATELWQNDHLVDDELIAAVHAIGLRIIPWTVDDPDRIAELIDMGVDGVCSNEPDVVRKLLT